MKEPCTLWEQAKVLGQARHLDLSGSCPVEASCKGTQCVYLAETRKDEDVLNDLRNEVLVIHMRNKLQNK